MVICRHAPVAALLIAVLAAVPACSRSLPARPGLPSTIPAASSRAAAPTSEIPAPPTVASPATEGTAAPTTGGFTSPAGGPVPTGFQPVSVTAVSVDEAWILGTAPCGTPPCTSLVRTTDGVRHFVGLPAPVAPLTQVDVAGGTRSPSDVGKVRFADPRTGYAFGPGLFVTHDGARSWHSLDLGADTVDLAAGGGFVYVLTGGCPPDQGHCAVPVQLVRAPVGSDQFTHVLTVPPDPVGAGYARLTLVGSGGYVTTGVDFETPGRVYGSADGRTWSTRTSPCPHGGSRPPLYGLADVAPDPAYLLALCASEPGAGTSQKLAYASSDAGRTWVKVGVPPTAGDSGQLAAPSRSVAVIATSSAASWYYRSSDGGRTWSTPQAYTDGGVGLSELGFTTARQGFAIHGRPSVGTGARTPGLPDDLLLTRDAGATWQVTPIR